MNGLVSLTSEEAHRHHALIGIDAARDAFFVRPRGAIGARPADLAALGFHPEGDPIAGRWLGPRHTALPLLHDALGVAPLFDLGPVFHDLERRLADAPRAWPGRFLLHVGGTPRCLAFGPPARAEELAPWIRFELDDYFFHQWVPVTE